MDADVFGNANGAAGAIVGAFVNGVTVASLQEREWADIQYTFTATSTSTLIKFDFIQEETGSEAFIVDDVSLVVVPEPSAALLGSIGFIGLLARRKR